MSQLNNLQKMLEADRRSIMLSEDCKHVLRAMLVCNPLQRASISEIQEHAWFKKSLQQEQPATDYQMPSSRAAPVMFSDMLHRMLRTYLYLLTLKHRNALDIGGSHGCAHHSPRTTCMPIKTRVCNEEGLPDTYLNLQPPTIAEISSILQQAKTSCAEFHDLSL